MSELGHIERGTPETDPATALVDFIERCRWAYTLSERLGPDTIPDTINGTYIGKGTALDVTVADQEMVKADLKIVNDTLEFMGGMPVMLGNEQAWLMKLLGRADEKPPGWQTWDVCYSSRPYQVIPVDVNFSSLYRYVHRLDGDSTGL